MLRVSIRATPDTDVDAETDNLRRVAEKDGLEPGLAGRLVDETNAVVRDFVNRGRELKALGSQLTADRAIRGDGYEIRVSFNTAPKPGVGARPGRFSPITPCAAAGARAARKPITGLAHLAASAR